MHILMAIDDIEPSKELINELTGLKMRLSKLGIDTEEFDKVIRAKK